MVRVVPATAAVVVAGRGDGGGLGAVVGHRSAVVERVTVAAGASALAAGGLALREKVGVAVAFQYVGGKWKQGD